MDGWGWMVCVVVMGGDGEGWLRRVVVVLLIWY